MHTKYRTYAALVAVVAITDGTVPHNMQMFMIGHYNGIDAVLNSTKTNGAHVAGTSLLEAMVSLLEIDLA